MNASKGNLGAAVDGAERRQGRQSDQLHYSGLVCPSGETSHQSVQTAVPLNLWPQIDAGKKERGEGACLDRSRAGCWIKSRFQITSSVWRVIYRSHDILFDEELAWNSCILISAREKVRTLLLVGELG